MDSHRSIDEHAEGFLKFIDTAPTIFHAVESYAERLLNTGYTRLSERSDWTQIIQPSGKYFLSRNGSSLVAFVVGARYEASNSIAMIGTHMDSLTMRVKPVSIERQVGFEQLKVSPYASDSRMTWWDRDLGLAGRVMVKNSSGKIQQRLVRLSQPFAKIPSLAEHFGRAADPPFDKETEMTPIIGCTEKPDTDAQDDLPINNILRNHSPRVLRAIADELEIDIGQIKELEIELFDYQSPSRLGLDGELLSVPRCDDKLCSYAALEALIETTNAVSVGESIAMVACFDDEEVGSLLRQGADSNLLPSVLSRIIESLNPQHNQNNLFAATMARSFLISADVEHAVNPNFVSAYGLKPRLNIGPVICCDSNANVTTDSSGKVIVQEIADRCGSVLQLSQIRNGQPSGGTIGPMLSSKLGVRSVDLGIVQLGMHSARGTTGSQDPGLGVRFYAGFLTQLNDVEKDLLMD